MLLFIILRLTPTYDSSDNLLNAALDDTNLFAEYSLNPSDFSTTADANTPESHLPGFYQRLFDIRVPSIGERFVVENVDISKQFYDFQMHVIDQ